MSCNYIRNHVFCVTFSVNLAIIPVLTYYSVSYAIYAMSDKVPKGKKMYFIFLIRLKCLSFFLLEKPIRRSSNSKATSTTATIIMRLFS